MSTDSTLARAQEYVQALRDTESRGARLRDLGQSLLGSEDGGSKETKLQSLLWLHGRLHIDERVEEPVKNLVDNLKSSFTMSAGIAADAILQNAENLRTEINRLVSAASPELLRQMKVVRTSDFGTDGTFVFEHDKRFGSRVVMGKMDGLPLDHELRELVPLDGRYHAFSDCRVVVLGNLRRWWYPLDVVLQLTATWRNPQRQREQDQRDQAERERVHREESVRQSESWRLADAERKIRDLEQRLASERRAQP